MIHAKRSTVALAVAGLLCCHQALATDGYFQTGFGVIQEGRGGAGVALPDDTFAAAINPAGLAWVGDRFDFGVTWFRPIRSGEITGNQLPPGYPDVNGVYSANGQTNFYLPEIGYSHRFSDRLVLGAAIYGNGGMNTAYLTPIPLLGTTGLGVNLQQLFISPAAAFRLNKHNSIGIAANLAGQQIAVTGLQNFASPSYSLSPGNVTNRGYSTSIGGGVRIGWLADVGHGLSLGATWQSTTWMSKFNQYSGLFAQGGGFNIPANFAGGAALKVHPKATLALDVERILYSEVKSIANSGANQAPLGAANGPGFGWQDITVIKSGIDLKASHTLTLRAGYNYSTQAIPASQTFFNLLAPATVQQHFSAGATWRFLEDKELSIAYVHAFEATLNGQNSIPPSAGGGNANLRMYQNSVGVGLGWNRGHQQN